MAPPSVTGMTTQPTRAKASVAYKKKDGSLLLSGNGQSLRWSAVSDDAPTLTVPIATITNLQQTPITAPKVMLKVFVQTSSTSAPESHVFNFTGPIARQEADAVKESLTTAIQAAKSVDNLRTSANSGGHGVSAALAMASAVSADGAGKSQGWIDDKKLLADGQLQQALLRSNPGLKQTLEESLRVKPETKSLSQFSTQFWSSRLNLLRAYVIDQSQRKGSYNVLSTIKPKTIDNLLRLSLSKEQISLIFGQHPLVRRVYDENVPKLDEEKFWSRFFQSRLLKKLKGEKITEADPIDAVLDKYLNEDNSIIDRRRPVDSHVPHFIDLEGNEENHSQRKGNRPDMTMRPTAVDRVPIIRSLNDLSQKIMNEVQPIDIDPADPIGVMEDNYQELELNDLQPNAEDPGMSLDLAKERQGRRQRDEEEDEHDAENEESCDPAFVYQALGNLSAELSSLDPDNLSLALEIDSESDESDDEADTATNGIGKLKSGTQAVNSKSGRIEANSNIFRSLPHASPDPPLLSPQVQERLLLTHATTLEFMHQFWSALLSTQPPRRSEARSALESLGRAVLRMDAVADDAERDREKELADRKREVREIYEQRGVKVRGRTGPVAGKKEVMILLGPTMVAVEKARRAYADGKKR